VPLAPGLELPLELDPMFGHGCPLVEPDFSVGAVPLSGVVDVDGVVEVDGVVVLDCDVVGVAVVLVVAVLCVVGAAEAPAIPAAAPPLASAPATIVAPSSLEMVMGRTSWDGWWVVPAIVREVAKLRCRWA
jgi:hypothetical protein